MYYITGDAHGDVRKFFDIREMYGLGQEDTLIVAGDFGCVFGLGSDGARLDRLAALPYRVLFLDGNHECFPALNAFPEETWNGGRVHRLKKNVLHLMRGQVFSLDGVSVFTMGGGFSIDKALRRPGISWWPEELPNDEEYAEAMRNLRLSGRKADIIISHAAPASGMTKLIEKGYIQNRAPQEAKLNSFLESVRRTVEHKLYYFGHMHVDDRLDPDLIAVYNGVYVLKTGERVQPKEL